MDDILLFIIIIIIILFIAGGVLLIINKIEVRSGSPSMECVLKIYIGMDNACEVLELLGIVLRVVQAVPKKAPAIRSSGIRLLTMKDVPSDTNCCNVETLHNRPMPNLKKDIYS
ncbi:hypothetical protein BDW67DRAFT_92984 [Aspergillus spinulosporus]